MKYSADVFESTLLIFFRKIKGVVMSLKKVIIIFVFLAVYVINSYCLGDREAASELENHFGIVTYMDGDVYLNGEETETGNTVIYGDIIETANDSFCEIIFNERNIISIHSNSVLEIGDSRSIKFSLQKGAIGVVADKLKKVSRGSERLVLKTPTAILGVRGTMFFVKVEDNKNTYMCLCNGYSNFYNGDGSGKERVESTHHKAFRYISDGGSFKKETADLLYHDDMDMEKLAAKIGVKVDWSRVTKY